MKRVSSMKKCVKIIGECFLGIVILFLICNMVINFVSVNYVAKFGNYALFDVNGNSMNPTLKDGDLIVIKTNESDYKVGDIISFVDTDEVIVTHKIVEIKENGCMITKGDNRDTVDDVCVLNDNVVGVYEGVRVPIVGYITRFTNTMFGFFLLVLVPLWLVFTICLYELIDAIKKRKKEEE